MVTLESLPDDTELCYRRTGSYEIQMTNKREVQEDIDSYEDCEVFIAVEHPAVFKMSDIMNSIRDMLDSEMEDQGQYEDWDSDMMSALSESEEAKQLVEFLNKTAKTYCSYDCGEQVSIPVRLPWVKREELEGRIAHAER